MGSTNTTVTLARDARPTSPPEFARRDVVFDILRVIGLFSIILAHVNPPNVLWALRTFDVPLMVLVSGAVFQIGFSGRTIALGAYFRKRAFRLLAPVYVFLVFYFAVSAIVTPGRFHGAMIWRTFLLLDGIGYVWIIRVFLIVALIAPFLLAWKRQLSPVGFLGLLGGIYLVHEVLFAWFDSLAPFAGDDLIEFTVFYLLPYSVVFGLGLCWPGMSPSRAFAIGIIALGVYVGLIVAFSGVPLFTLMRDHKYPPHLVYFWYGLGVSHLLYAAVLSLFHPSGKLSATIEWLSASSLWIYLWHIPGLTIAGKIIERFHFGRTRFAAAWILTVVFAVTVTYVQKVLVQWLITRTAPRKEISDTLATVFLK